MMGEAIGFWDYLSLAWVQRALLTAVMVGVTCGILGCFIVLRNMSLLGDALSHAILPGVYFAFLLFGYSTLGFFWGSTIAGLVAAVLITWIQVKARTKSDAVIGIVFTSMFAIGVIGISSLNEEQGVHLDLKDFLFGNILGLTTSDLWISLGVLCCTVLSVVSFYRYFFISSFQPVVAQTMGIHTAAIHYYLMLLLSIAVVSTIRSVGVILVISLLIAPASTALLWSDKLKKVIVMSAILGVLCSIIGFTLAIAKDLPPGPSIVLVNTFFFGISIFFNRKSGLFVKFWKRRILDKEIEKEDILKALLKHESENPSASEFLELSGFKMSQLRPLIGDGCIVLHPSESKNVNHIRLTAKGHQMAETLTRAHRLWETYQVHEMGLSGSQIHDEADRVEHLLKGEILDELDKNLGFPQADPHGSPIPGRRASVANSLLHVKPKSNTKISNVQPNLLAESFLWEQSIMGGDVVKVLEIGRDEVTIFHKKSKVKVPAEIAAQISTNK